MNIIATTRQAASCEANSGEAKDKGGKGTNHKRMEGHIASDAKDGILPCATSKKTKKDLPINDVSEKQIANLLDHILRVLLPRGSLEVV